MGDISYTPTFQHVVEYRDGEDPVRAEGQNGFNDRFHAIEDDLKQLSTVVAAIDAKLDQLEAPPAPTTRRLTLPLRFLTSTTAVLPHWDTGPNGTAEATPGRSASGFINLVLPDGILLKSLRAAGQTVGVSVEIVLAKNAQNGGSSTLATIVGNSNPFDKTEPIDPAQGLVDTNSFGYTIFATVSGTTAPNTATASISGLQLTVSS